MAVYEEGNSFSVTHEHTTFLHLPPEIRVVIYRLFFHGNHLILRSNYVSHVVSVRRVYNHRVIYSCKQIYSEAKPILDEMMVVRLRGNLHLRFLGPERIATVDDKIFISDASPIIEFIPPSILQTVTTVESSLRYMSHAKLLNAFANLKTLHILDDDTLSPASEMRVRIKCWCEQDLADLAEGVHDDTIVQNQTRIFEDPTKELLHRLIFIGRRPLVERTFKVLITTRGCADGPLGQKLRSSGAIPMEREITYDYDTLQIESRRNRLVWSP